MMTPRGILGIVIAAAFLATGLWYALGTFTVTETVTGRPSSVDVGVQPLETRAMTIECRSDGGSSYVTDAGQTMSFDGASWQPESPNPFCEEARRGRYPLAIGLAVLGTIIGVVVAASGARSGGDD